MFFISYLGFGKDTQKRRKYIQKGGEKEKKEWVRKKDKREGEERT